MQHSLAIRVCKGANRTLLSAILKLIVLTKLDPEGDDVVDFKYRFQSSARIHQTRRIKKVHSEEQFKNMRFPRADSLVSCGRKGDSHKDVCGFKRILIRVRPRPNEFKYLQSEDAKYKKASLFSSYPD